LTVNAYPFLQQDGRAVICAHVALSTIAQYFAEDFDLKKTTAPYIAEKAFKFTGESRRFPSRGLTVEEIGFTLKELGFEPLIYDYKLASPQLKARHHPEQIIYHYLESKIPVIAVIKTVKKTPLEEPISHAIVVNGHTFSPDAWMSLAAIAYYNDEKTGMLYHCNTNWIEDFLVQDDNFGPYMLASTSFLQYVACQAIIVPLPHNIFLTAEEVEQFVAHLLLNKAFLGNILAKKYRDQIHKDNEYWLNQFLYHVQKEELVLRTYLIGSKEWKNNQMEKAKNAGYEKKLYEIELPEKIWVVEISWPFIFRHTRFMCGEVLIDPSEKIIPDEQSLMYQAYLWVHLPGIIVTRKPKNVRYDDPFVLNCPDSICKHYRTIGHWNNV